MVNIGYSTYEETYSIRGGQEEEPESLELFALVRPLAAADPSISAPSAYWDMLDIKIAGNLEKPVKVDVGKLLTKSAAES